MSDSKEASSPTDQEVASVTAFAPASIGNVAVGFDVLGCVFGALGDRVHAVRIEAPTVRIEEITGIATDLPRRPEENTATVGLLELIEDHGLPFGFAIRIEKGIPLRAGLGGSAASAVAAIRAASELLDTPLSKKEMLRYALAGESVASGAPHGDNVTPILYGGLMLTRSLNPLDVVSIPVPDRLWSAVVRPDLEIATRHARTVVPDMVALSSAVQQSANLGGVVAGCFQGDLDLIGRSLSDVLIEPHRAELIPAFSSVQAAIEQTEALGGSISGAGPSVFAWCEGKAAADRVGDAMAAAFANEGIATDGWTAPVGGKGAQVEELGGTEYGE